MDLKLFKKFISEKYSVPMKLLRPSHFRLQGEDAKLRSRKCEGAKVRLSLLRRRTYTLSPLHLRAFAFAYFNCIQRFSANYIEIDARNVLARYLRNTLGSYWYACAKPLCLLWVFIYLYVVMWHTWYMYMLTSAGYAYSWYDPL